MRSTVDNGGDVLHGAMDLARRQQIAAGQIISRLLRERVTGLMPDVADAAAEVTVNAAGFRPLPSRGVLVSNELVNALRDREGV